MKTKAFISIGTTPNGKLRLYIENPETGTFVPITLSGTARYELENRFPEIEQVGQVNR